MSTEDKMAFDERTKYLRRMKTRYEQAGRKERGRLLDEMEAVTELHRQRRPFRPSDSCLPVAAHHAMTR